MALFTVQELADYLEADLNTARATLLRDLVTGLIATYAGDSFDVDTAPVSVKGVGIAVAARAYSNPDGVTSSSVAIDDYSKTDRWESDAAGLYLTEDERTTLALAYPLATSRNAFTITPYYEPPTSPIESWA